MKSYLLLFFMVLAQQVYAQTKADINVVTKSFKSIVDINAKSCKLDGSGVAPIMTIINAGTYFTVVNETDTSYVIKLWRYDEKRDTANYKEFNVDSVGNTKYFSIEKKDLQKCVVAYNTKGVSWVGGTVIIPIKLRSDPFDFSKDFTVGPALALQKRLSRTRDIFFDLAFSVGVSSVRFDSLSTQGTVKQTRDVAAFSFAFGTLFEFNSFQFGLFMGQDRVSAASNENWRYNGKMWYSIGLGYTIFSQPKKGDDRDTPKQK